jgi:ADP-ribose pyrophosphatase YjhB (NUDIX family)
LSEETGLEISEVEPLVIVVHDDAERPVRLHAFLARRPQGEVRMTPSREWGWKTLAELHELEMPEANRQILHALRWRLAGPGNTLP